MYPNQNLNMYRGRIRWFVKPKVYSLNRISVSPLPIPISVEEEEVEEKGEEVKDKEKVEDEKEDGEEEEEKRNEDVKEDEEKEEESKCSGIETPLIQSTCSMASIVNSGEKIRCMKLGLGKV